MSKLKEITGNKWFVILGSGFILLMLIVQIRQYRSRSSVNSEIEKLSKQADQIQKNNQDLQEMIAYLNTDSYKEKTAREQLNLRKDGETVYSFATPPAQAPDPEQAREARLATESNIAKWWEYFFNAN